MTTWPLVDERVELRGADRVDLAVGVEGLGAAGVQHLHQLVVRRKRRDVTEDLVDEGFARESLAQVRIGQALETQRGHRTRAHARAAHRTGAVRRVHLDEVGERRQLGRDAVVELAGQRALDVVADQVGAAERTDEEEVARQQHLRHLGRARQVVDEKGQVLGRVAGRVQRLDAGLAQRERVAFVHRRVRERGLVELALVVRGDVDVGAGGLGQRLGAGGEIGVDVRLEDADDPKVSGMGEVEVDVDVATRIDDDHLALALATDSVGIVRKAFVFEAFEEHSRIIFL